MNLKELTILLVDDVPKDMTWLEQSIAPLGFNLMKTDNPQDVMPRVEAARPDLVILDALLPGISGFDLCKRIKTHPQLAETLVVIITGVYLKEQYRRDAIQSFQADGFVTKPCRPVELQRVVLGLLAKRLGTTPLALGAKLKHRDEESPLIGPEQETGWWGRLWSRLTGTGGKSVETSPAPSEEERQDAPQEELAGVSEGSPDRGSAETGSNAGQDEMKLAELLAEDSASESSPAPTQTPTETEEPESTEGTVRLLPGELPVSPSGTRVAQRIVEKPASSPPIPPEPSPKDRRAPRPEAIHRGVPIYGEEDFLFELRREVARCQRFGRPLTLILIRVTDLEQIVEMVGSGFRRQLLWHVAEQSLETLRQVDLAGHLTSHELVGLIAFGSGRYGGRRIVSRVQRAIKRHPFSVGEGLPAIVPALRFGIAAFPKEGEDLDALIAHARRELAP
ncbi:MAG: GGDEF domain-containing response regulator [Vicinamibacteria bacterium]